MGSKRAKVFGWSLLLLCAASLVARGEEKGGADESGKKPRSAEELKQFNAGRIEELKRVVGGDWQLVETKHFFLFFNLPPQHLPLLQQHVEHVFERMKQYLGFDESDPIWHNKCGLYLCANRARFETFAKEVAKYPKGVESGGFFVHSGREAIVCDLFDDRRFSGQEQVRQCLNGVSHDVGEAILQLAGYTEILSPWLRNGMNVFIEFALEDERYQGGGLVRNQIRGVVSKKVKAGEILSWAQGNQRPDKYTDLEGYGFAYTRIAFLQAAFPDKKKIPQFIQMIKTGVKENDALQQAFGKKVDDLEAAYRQWLGPALQQKLLFR